MLLLLSLACGDKDVIDSGDTVGTFAEVDTILNRSCSFDSCHSASASAAGFSVEGDSYAAMVGVASAQQPDIHLVEAGDSANSYLVMKLEGAEGITNDAMPPPNGGLDAADIATITSWIDAGAPE